MQNTISIHVGNTSSIVHNNRLTNKHANQDIDSTRSHKNIVIKQENIKESYEKLFGDAVDSYNAKQKRSDRKIKNYFQKVKESTIDHQKEFILQVGDFQSLEKIAKEQGCKVWETKEWELRTETLKRAVSEFQEHNPNLYVYNAVIHLDESNPHAHINFIPIGDGMNKGMSRQVSMNRALENMGYDAKFVVSEEAKNVRERGRIKLDNSTNFKNWREDNLERVKEIAREVYKEAGYQFEFIEGNKSKEHQSVEAYKKAIEDAKEKSKEIITQAKKTAEMEREEVSKQCYDLWEKEWEKTEEEFPDFKFQSNTQKVAEITGHLDLFHTNQMYNVDKMFPRVFLLSPKQVFQLLQEKIKQVHEYIALQAREMASKVSELINRVNILEKEEKRLETKIEANKEKLSDVNVTLAKQNAIEKVSNDLKKHLYSLSEVSEEESGIKIKKGFWGEQIVTLPYSKFEALKLSSYDGAFRKGKDEFDKAIENTIKHYKNSLEISENKVEEYKQKYENTRLESRKYFNKYQEKSDLVKAYEEVVDYVPAQVWNEAIEKREIKIAEQEMLNRERSKGMSGPSL